MINAAMRIERQKHLGAGPYERTPERRGYANGFKPKTMATRVGEITFDIPQVRESDFYPSSLEKGIRSERGMSSLHYVASTWKLLHTIHPVLVDT